MPEESIAELTSNFPMTEAPRPFPDQSLTQIETHLLAAAGLYNSGQYLDAMNWLSYETDQGKQLIDTLGLTFLHGTIAVIIDNEQDSLNPKYLPKVIRLILNAGRAPNASRIQIPAKIIIAAGKDRPQPLPKLEIPPLWKKVQALCYLEEWTHILIHRYEEKMSISHSQDYDDVDKYENEVAVYLRDRLKIKLPKYFLEGYQRSLLNLPVEDHDFDTLG